MLEVWGTAVVGRSRSLDFFIGQIRAKLAGLPLQTVRGLRFSAGHLTWACAYASSSSSYRFSRLRPSQSRLAMSLADRRTAALAAERDRQLAALADAAAVPDIPLQRLVDRYHEVYGEGLLIIDSDGRNPGRHADSASPNPASRPRRTMRARRRTGVAVGSDPAVATDDRLLATEGVRQRRGAGRRRRNGRRHHARQRAMSPTAGCGWRSAVWPCSYWPRMVARALTRWVLRPLNGLERAVAEMTEGIAGPPADVAGPPELRHFTSAFNTMAQVVRASLDRQRRLVADASHQLRNPLAAVRLRADSLDDYVAEAGQFDIPVDDRGAGPSGKPAAAAATPGPRRAGQRQPQGGSNRRQRTESTDLEDVIGERVAFWQPVADGQHQQLHDRSDHLGLAVQVARHDVEQLLDVALDNALRYAGPRRHSHGVNRAQTGGIVESSRERRRLRLARRGPVEGRGTILARTRRWRRNRSRVGYRRRDRCGPRRGDRRGEGTRRRPPGPLPAAGWRASRHDDRPIRPS